MPGVFTWISCFNISRTGFSTAGFSFNSNPKGVVAVLDAFNTHACGRSQYVAVRKRRLIDL